MALPTSLEAADGQSAYSFTVLKDVRDDVAASTSVTCRWEPWNVTFEADVTELRAFATAILADVPPVS